jgi:hypothetical protein
MCNQESGITVAILHHEIIIINREGRYSAIKVIEASRACTRGEMKRAVARSRTKICVKARIVWLNSINDM